MLHATRILKEDNFFAGEDVMSIKSLISGRNGQGGFVHGRSLHGSLPRGMDFILSPHLGTLVANKPKMTTSLSSLLLFFQSEECRGAAYISYGDGMEPIRTTKWSSLNKLIQ